MILEGRGHATLSRERADFYARLKPYNLAPLWEVLSSLVTPEPVSAVVPARWSLLQLAPFLEEAGTIISAEEAERRVLILENPGLTGWAATTSTLYAGLQVILPGEIARAHRHTQGALRFILRGSGAFTALNGERVVMHPYDLVLTPGWVWHDHGNETSVPMVWLDGLDIPLIRSLDASFAEHRADGLVHPRKGNEGSRQERWGRGIRPARLTHEEVQSNPITRYPHAAWRSALEAQLSSGAPHPHDAYRIEFVNPVDGGAVLGTMSAFAQFIPRGFETTSVRSSDSKVLVVTEGLGRINIGDTGFNVAEGDILAIPTWKTLTIRAESDLVLFSFSDKVTHEKLGLWREELL